ncbi:MAG: glycosyltransferase [Saprospiraceae bacterium]|nr:glycosyltransferase [Saprospiraceae bacterium]
MSKTRQKKAKVPKKRRPDFKGKLSLVIPCFNEKERVPKLIKTLSAFESEWSGELEIIIVDDGSTDGTTEKAQKLLEKTFSNAKDYQIITLPKNEGKGGALKAGVQAATGDFILTLDADMATQPQELFNWLESLPNQAFSSDEILIGSREHKDSQVQGTFIRRLAGLIFNFIIQILTNLNLRDTQCGFKLYPQAIAKQLFGELKVKGWAHDVELLSRAKHAGYGITSMPVKWDHQEGSKISLVRDSFTMFGQALRIGFTLFIERFISEPIQSFRAKGAGQEPSYYRLFFLVLSLVLLVGMPMLSFDYGITGDEEVQKIYGEKLLSYYETDGEENSALSYKNLYYYGGLFDYTAAWANKYIGGLDEYEMRHVLNALVGFLLMLFTGLLAKEMSGSWRVGFWALLFMAISPRIFGHSMNNPKDIPFAATYVFSLLYIIRFVKELPRPGARTVFLLIVGIAASINVRVGGILLIAYLGFFVGLRFLLQQELRTKILHFPTIGRVGALLGLIVVGGYFGGMLYWPYGWQAPFSNPFKALGEMSNFSTSIRMLFEGEHLWSDELPWYYIPKWISIASPIFVLLGALVFPFLLIKERKKADVWLWLFLLYTMIFPVVYAIAKQSSLYDGMRHFLFVYPVLVVVAAKGWDWLSTLLPAKGFQLGTQGAMAVLVAIPLLWMVRNHPYQASYFNPVSGGIQSAFAHYETDYWMNSMKELSQWFVANNEDVKSGKEVTIATTTSQSVGHYMKALAPNVKVVYTRYNDRHKKPADYYFFYSRFVNEGLQKSGAWPPDQLVHEIKAGGVPIASISKRNTSFDLEGFQLEQSNNIQGALEAYQKEVAANPKNEVAWMGVASTNYRLGNYPASKAAIDQMLTLSPSHLNHNIWKGLYHKAVGELEEAKAAFERCIELNYKSNIVYYHLATIYAGEQNMEQVLRLLEQFDMHNGNLPQGYDMAIGAANALGKKWKAVYFQAKKAYFQKDYQNSYRMLTQALPYLRDYEPATKLKALYDRSQAQQQKNKQ